MTVRRLGAVASVGLLGIMGCGQESSPGQPVVFASQAVPSVSAVPRTAEVPPSTAPDETAAVLAAYTEYVLESDRFFDESIAQAAATGTFAGSADLDAILDAVAVGRIRDFDMETPMVLWEEGGVATVGTPIVVSAEVVNVGAATSTAQLQACTDLTSVNYLDSAGNPLKPSEVPEFLLEQVTLVMQSNPRNGDIVRWYVENRVSEQVKSCDVA